MKHAVSGQPAFTEGSQAVSIWAEKGLGAQMPSEHSPRLTVHLHRSYDRTIKVKRVHLIQYLDTFPFYPVSCLGYFHGILQQSGTMITKIYELGLQ